MSDSVSSSMTAAVCSYCGRRHDIEQLLTVCGDCGKVLLVHYDLDAASASMTKESLRSRRWNLWRYAEIMPVRSADHRLTLGEGGTPLLSAARIGAEIGLSNLLVKDEGRNPTGSFKARGLGAAVSRARELGINAIALPSAGNAAAAACAYAARGGMEAVVFMPFDAPPVFKAECRALGARVFLVNGLINDAGAIVRQHSGDRGWFDVSTLKEPYRAEGKKTMGIEIVEQLGWRVPDAIIYPTGGGTGIVGMWKAFDELERMGLIGPQRPKMIVVQASGCAPIVKAYHAGERHAPVWENAVTEAPGLRVPVAIGDYLILDAVRQSGGTAVAVDDTDLLAMTERVAATEGMHVSPEAGAAFVAASRLREEGFLQQGECVVAFATGSGLLHTELVPDGYPLLQLDDPLIGSVIDNAYSGAS
ncbi:MAG TPA: threonine synthase [Thermomicrobiales bacterium]|nr:threonine synthase [Thermomicrobiales bacterium]